MKKIWFTMLLLLVISNPTFSKENMGIGTTNPNASALLDLDPPNRDKGLLIPRLDSTQRKTITNPAESLLIFNTDTQCYEGYSTQKTQWFSLGCLQKESTCGEGKDLTDGRDGNTYKTVQIGEQCWMAENLKFLPSVVGANTGDATTPYYYVFGYNGTDVSVAKAEPNYSKGVLYNWAAVMQGEGGSDAAPSGVKGVCPTGWRVPSDGEWREMEIYLGMGIFDASNVGWRDTGVVGEKLKTNTWGGN